MHQRPLGPRRAGTCPRRAGRLLMPPANIRPVEASGLSNVSMTDTLDHRSRDGPRILGITGVTGNRNSFYDAVLLVYKDLDANTIRLGRRGRWGLKRAPRRCARTDRRR
jgi:hypothetical protein